MNEHSIFRAFIGTEFTAEDKLGKRYRYRATGYDPQDISREFKLHNLTTDTFTGVEKEWFHQRKITLN